MISKCTNENYSNDSGDESDVNPSKKRKHSEVDNEEEESGSGTEEEWTDESEDEEDCEEEDNDVENDYSQGSDQTSDSESYETDDESEEESGADTSLQKKKESSTNVVSDSESEGSHREICAICLSYMKGEIGSPELCDHSFCLECILEWAKTNNSCPQDRTQFLQVFVRKKVKGKIIRTITVQEVKPEDPLPEDDEDPTFCEVCGRCDREDTLLLCDGCDSGHHLECLTPPLTTVPVDEWFCPECEVLNRERAAQEVSIGVEEVTELMDDAGFVSLPTNRRRRLPRTRATERVRRVITRARTQRGDIFESLDSAIDEENEDVGSLLETSTLGQTKSMKKMAKPPAKTKRKVIKRKRRKVCRKKTAKPKAKRKSTVKRKTTRKKKTKTVKKSKTGVKRRRTKKGRRKRRVKRKQGKKKIVQPIVTPKARLAEALGIRPLKNPWQLSVPAMTGSINQTPQSSLTNQRYRAGLPSLSLLGSNSELDYISEPDEFGDAILAAGVRRGHSLSAETLIRRKAMAAELLRSRPLLNRISDRLENLPISDCSVSSAGDILGNIIESQNQLLKTGKPKRLSKEDHNDNVKTIAMGANSPKQDGNNARTSGTTPNSFSNRPQNSFNNNFSETTDNGNYSSNFSSMRSPTNGDPTGSQAYSSYLRSHSNDDYDKRKKSPKKDERRRNEEVDLYSDIEPESIDCEEEDSDNEVNVAQNKSHNDEQVDFESSLSGEDELVIDDSVKHGEYKARQNDPKTFSSANEGEVGSSDLPALNDFELEEVSDTDIHDLDNKSINSSISLSDSNIGDPEVTSSTNVNDGDTFSSSVPQRNRYYRDSGNINEPREGLGMNLQDLETEIISDSDEICFDDNYEEGEIPTENVASRALPPNRPRINIHIKKFSEVSSPNKEFDGDCEEGEIVDDDAVRKERREKAKKVVEEVVNQTTETVVPNNVVKESTNTVRVNTAEAFLSEIEISSDFGFSSPEKPHAASKADKKSSAVESDMTNNSSSVSDKDTSKDKFKDISFKKISSNTKVRNYRESDQESRKSKRSSRERSHGRDKLQPNNRDKDRNKNEKFNKENKGKERNKDGYGKGRDHGKDKYSEKDKRESKRKEKEIYNVRQLINKKEEEKKRTDEFGRDVILRSNRPPRRSRSRSRSKARSRSKSKRKVNTKPLRTDKNPRRRSRSRSKSRYSRSHRRRSYSSSSTSSSTTSSSSSSSYSSSSSSSRSRSHKKGRDQKRRRSRSRSKSPVKRKKIEKRKSSVKPIEKPKKATVPLQKKKDDKKEKISSTPKEDEAIKSDKHNKKKKKKEKSPLQSKEVYQAGGSIMVSVNFSQKNQGKEKDLKKKDKEVREDSKKKRSLDLSNAEGAYDRWSQGNLGGRSHSPDGKHTPLQDEPMWSLDNLHHEDRTLDSRKISDMADADIIMVTPPTQEPILISDSDDEGITRLPPDLGVQHMSPIPRSQGPKTPPEPGVKFTLSSKPSFKSINNPLEENERNSEIVPPRGPNTPPGPPPESDESVGRPKSPNRRIPRSPVGTPPASSPEPDVYDPFEPTKSPSPPLASPQQEARVSSSDQAEQNVIEVLSPSVASVVSTKSIPSPAPPPPLPTDSTQEDKPPEPRKGLEDEATSIAPTKLTQHVISSPVTTLASHNIVSQLTSAPSETSLPPSTAVLSLPGVQTAVNSQIINPVQQIFASLPANVANILYPAAIAAAAFRGATNTILHPPASQSVVPPDLSRPPPPTAALLSRPPPVTPSKFDKTKLHQNGQNADAHEGETLSPKSPDSSDVSDIFEPPSPRVVHSGEKPSPKKSRHSHGRNTSPSKATKSMDKFDSLFGSNAELKLSRSNHKSKGNEFAKAKYNLSQNTKDVEEDIPNSAVDLQVKERLLKKVQRQERVVDEVKLCLKPFYNKKVVSKEDYKDIMKRCVQKVCHNRSGEINPNKIRSLVEGYVKKVKYYKKKIGAGGNSASGILSRIKSGNLTSSAFPPAVNESSSHLSKSHLKAKQ